MNLVFIIFTFFSICQNFRIEAGLEVLQIRYLVIRYYLAIGEDDGTFNEMEENSDTNVID